MAGRYALHTTSSVVSGRAPLKQDTNVYLAPEKTRNCEFRFAESRVFKRERISMLGVYHLCPREYASGEVEQVDARIY
mgnify:CR=1 FL=1